VNQVGFHVTYVILLDGGCTIYNVQQIVLFVRFHKLKCT